MSLLKVGQKIKSIRRMRNISMRDLADRAEISLSVLARMERGESVTTNSLNSVLTVLGLSIHLETAK